MSVSLGMAHGKGEPNQAAAGYHHVPVASFEYKPTTRKSAGAEEEATAHALEGDMYATSVQAISLYTQSLR